MARRAAAGTGTIRKKTINRNGKEYIYWEARYTAGYDPGTGKQIQRSVTGKTQKEVSKKLKEATAAIDAGTYIAPSKLTVGQWLDTWATEYLGDVKPLTVSSYKSSINIHIKPGLGALKLESLPAHSIQAFLNSLENEKQLSPKTIKNVHGVLHAALQQAVANGYIRFNPADACVLPRREKREIKPLDEEQISTFLKAIKEHPLRDLFEFTLFTGLREGEALGLKWDCVDFKKGTILVNKQLQQVRASHGEYVLVPTKNGKSRTITVAPYVLSILKRARKSQLENRLKYGECWESTGLVFTDVLGGNLKHNTVYKNFKRVMAGIDLPEARFHDLRHSYAVASIRSGDDVKTVQENLGHATASFTLDTYGHVTERMKKESADRMEQFIKAVNK